MKKIFVILYVILVQSTLTFCQTSQNDFPVLKGPYLGQKPPGNIPEFFAPEIMTNQGGYHSTIVFSPDLKEAVWRPMNGNKGGLFYSKLENGKWSSPVEMTFGMDYGIGDPCFSPDGRKLFFLSFKPHKPGVSRRERIWFAERTETGWTIARVIDDVVTAHPTHWTFSATRSGNLYFTSQKEGVLGEQDIYMARYDGVKYLAPEDLGPAINSTDRDFTPFTAPDESYIIFSRTDKTGTADLYISRKNSDGKWTEALNMGSKINTRSHELAPYVSPDGKYLFFLGMRNGKSSMMWVSMEAINDFLKPNHKTKNE